MHTQSCMYFRLAHEAGDGECSSFVCNELNGPFLTWAQSQHGSGECHLWVNMLLSLFSFMIISVTFSSVLDSFKRLFECVCANKHELMI